MTGISISSLISATTPLTGAELVPVVQSGTTAKTTVAALGAAVAYTPAGTGAVTTTVQSKLRETVSVKDFGAMGDGVTDDTAAIQAALNYANTVSGCEIKLPKGTYLCSSSLNIYQKTILCGEGRKSSTLQFSNTGDGVKSTWPINSSTGVHIAVRDLGIVNTNGSNTGGGFVDVGGSFVDLYNVYFSGFKYGVIFDQTEVSTIENSEFLCAANGVGVWLVNGADHTVGANALFTNRITIAKNQFNAGATTIANILDDGGDNHSINDNNFNGGLIGIRAAQAYSFVICGNEHEVHLDCDIYLTDTKYSGTYVGPCWSPEITGNTLISGTGGRNIAIQSCNGGTIANNFFGQAASAIAFIDGASNKAAGIIIEGNTKLVTSANRTAGPFLSGFSGPLASQVIRQTACTYVSASQAAGTITVTPASMEFINVGAKLVACNSDGTNSELIVVTAVTSTTFTATFVSTKAAYFTLNGVNVSSPSTAAFTPTIIGTITTGAGTYTTQTGYYNRIGNVVYFNINLIWTAHTGTGNMQVSGLPFKAISGSLTPISCIPLNIALSANNYLTAYVLANDTKITLLQITTATTAANLTPLDTAGELYLSGTYLTDAN